MFVDKRDQTAFTLTQIAIAIIIIAFADKYVKWKNAVCARLSTISKK